ncbi:MAG TPA: FliA/WhiG family RNA polymerase sigma factor [Bryobacteraceae bacterium]|nr:FliA/WhiG family RNA polymerase sigma factor [Bryobacteraceae bacterium]
MLTAHIQRNPLGVNPGTVRPERRITARAAKALHNPHHGERKAARLRAAEQARRDRLVMEHLSLVRAIAVRHQQNLPVHVDLDDLEHAGVLGLFDAATKYTPEKQVPFSSYAQHRIKGAILDSLRQLDWATRNMRRRQRQIEAVTNKLATALQRSPSEAEVAQEMGMDAAQWRAATFDLQTVSLVSASARGPENDEVPDFPCNPNTHPDSICALEQLRGALDQAMQSLPERHRRVVRSYYIDQMTMREIGAVLGINESRVSQIHKSALSRMAATLASNGITSSRMF